MFSFLSLQLCLSCLPLSLSLSLSPPPSLSHCARIRSLMSSLNRYTTKRKRKGKQEGRRGHGSRTDGKHSGAELKKKRGKSGKFERRRRTGQRERQQDWECVCENELKFKDGLCAAGRVGPCGDSSLVYDCFRKWTVLNLLTFCLK